MHVIMADLRGGSGTTFQLGFVLLKQNRQPIFQHITTQARHERYAMCSSHCHDKQNAENENSKQVWMLCLRYTLYLQKVKGHI